MAVVIRQHRPEFALMLGLAASILILISIINAATEVMSKIEELVSITGLPDGYIQILFKALGISIITQLAADSCSDAGEKAIASKVELAGKVAILVISLPLFEKLLEIVKELFSI